MGHKACIPYRKAAHGLSFVLVKHRSILPMMTQSNWNIFRVTGLLYGEFTGRPWSPVQRPVTRSFDISLTWAWTNGWVNSRNAGDLRHHRAHRDVTVMFVLPDYFTITFATVRGPWDSIYKAVKRLTAKSREVARLDVIMTVSLWNLTSISAALLPRCLSNFRAIQKVYTWIVRLRYSRDLAVRRSSAQWIGA